MVVAAIPIALVPQVAWAQLTFDPTATPTRPPDNFTNWMGYGGIILGALLALATIGAYLRYSTRFFGSERERGPRAGAPAPPMLTVGAQARHQPRALAASPARPPVPVRQTPVGVAASAGQAAASAPARPAPAPFAEAARAPAPEAISAPPAQAAPEPSQLAPSKTEAPPATPARATSELDQETFDRVLQEELAKGSDRRVAEGKARSAAVRAARQKSGG